MFDKFNYVAFGILTGIYVSQNYNIPELAFYIDMAFNYIRKLEEENRK